MSGYERHGMRPRRYRGLKRTVLCLDDKVRFVPLPRLILDLKLRAPRLHPFLNRWLGLKEDNKAAFRVGIKLLERYQHFLNPPNPCRRVSAAGTTACRKSRTFCPGAMFNGCDLSSVKPRFAGTSLRASYLKRTFSRSATSRPRFSFGSLSRFC
jgi:hypothetical protein